MSCRVESLRVIHVGESGVLTGEVTVLACKAGTNFEEIQQQERCFGNSRCGRSSLYICLVLSPSSRTIPTSLPSNKHETRGWHPFVFAKTMVFPGARGHPRHHDSYAVRPDSDSKDTPPKPGSMLHPTPPPDAPSGWIAGDHHL